MVQQLKTEQFLLHNIPAVLYGEQSQAIYLFVHGQGGNKEEAAAFAKIAVSAGVQVLGIDLPEHGDRKKDSAGFNPWTVVPELRAVMAYLKQHWRKISLRANSIGAYFSMLAFPNEKIQKALFVSPIVDMEQLIHKMMGWAGITESTLCKQMEIPTDFGQTLSWQYLCWVREHPLKEWHVPTAILYAGQDNLTSRETIAAFATSHGASLTIYELGEHWFHTSEQLKTLCNWERKTL